MLEGGGSVGEGKGGEEGGGDSRPKTGREDVQLDFTSVNTKT